MSDEYETVTRRIEQTMPDLAEAALNDGAPIIVLMCPNGHYLMHVQLKYDMGLRLHRVTKHGGFLDDGSAVGAYDATGGDRMQVCWEAGCPNLMPCTDHPVSTDGQGLPGIGYERLQIKCPDCVYDGRYSDVQLLNVYVTAVVIHLGSTPTGTLWDQLTSPRTLVCKLTH
jgi:hypothetical protein